MTTSDTSTVTAVGVLALALVALASSFGVDLPLAWAGIAPLVAAIIIAVIRIYVAIVGAENTTVDESLEQAEQAIRNLAERAKKGSE